MKTDLAKAVEKNLQLTEGRDSAKSNAEISFAQLSQDYKVLAESRDRVTIIRAEYGGKSYKNDISVYSKLLGHINNNQERQQDCGWPTQDV